MHISHKPKCSYPLRFHPLFISELNLTCFLVKWRRYNQNEGERGHLKGRERSSVCIVSLQWVCAEEVNQIYIVIFAWQVQEGRPGDMLAALLTWGDIILFLWLLESWWFLSTNTPDKGQHRGQCRRPGNVLWGPHNNRPPQCCRVRAQKGRHTQLHCFRLTDLSLGQSPNFL